MSARAGDVHEAEALPRSAPGRLDRFARRAVLDRLRLIETGSLRLTAGKEDWCFGRNMSGAPAATVHIRDAKAFAELAFGGAIGAAEAYMLGLWEADDLTSAMRVLLRNRGVLDELDTGVARLQLPVQRVLHWLNRNTRAGSRRNIAAHYDLGNEFFGLWLYESLLYSAA